MIFTKKPTRPSSQVHDLGDVKAIIHAQVPYAVIFTSGADVIEVSRSSLLEALRLLDEVIKEKEHEDAP